jgi:hypothetical protein
MDQILATLVPSQSLDVSSVFPGGAFLAALDSMMKAGHVCTTLSRWSIKNRRGLSSPVALEMSFRLF